MHHSLGYFFFLSAFTLLDSWFSVFSLQPYTKGHKEHLKMLQMFVVDTMENFSVKILLLWKFCKV